MEKLNECQKVNYQAKKKIEEQLAENAKRDNKSFFAYVRSKQRTKDKVGPLIDKAGKTITDDKEAASVLNEYFSSTFTIENMNNIPKPLQVFKGNLKKRDYLDITITEEMVMKKLEKLNTNKCPGIDQIHPKLLFELRETLAAPLTKLFVTSLEQGVVPSDWKDAGVTPLFKKGKKSDPTNYRPVSLTSIVCKIMESIIKDEISEHLVKHSLIRPSQHGFMAGRSCLTNLLDFMEKVTEALDKSNAVDIIYLDFAKAFDSVPHQRLFQKLESHGIGENISKWIRNWLTARRQKVSVKGQYSEWENVVSGVPQGSVLGPILFLIYINDIDEGIISKLGKFADDTKLCSSGINNEDVESLQQDLDRIFQWSLEWQMQFNVNKCVVIHMGRTNNQVDYKMGNAILRKSENERDLGVLVSSNGKFSEQCVLAAKKANAVLGMIKRNIKFKSMEVIKCLYKALVRPKLEYCV